MNRSLKKNDFLVSVIFALVFLSIAVSQVSAATYFPAGTAKCSILPGDPSTSTEYCPTCPHFTATCEHKPTPGLSGCDCAELKCQDMVNRDACDWTEGIHICKAVCNDISELYFCSRYASTKALTKGIPVPPIGLFEIAFVKLQDYVPLGGCCNPYASYNECNNTNNRNAHCLNLKTSSICKSGYNCCLIAGEKGCTVNADCCSSSDKCVSGTCKTCKKVNEICDSSNPCCSGYSCSGWLIKTCKTSGGGSGSRVYMMDITTVVAGAVVIALGALAIIFGIMKLATKKGRK